MDKKMKIEVVQFEPKTIYSLRRLVDGDNDKICALYNDKERDFNASRLERIDGFFTIFHKGDIDMECGGVIPSDTPIGDRVRKLDLGLCCCTTVFGSYDGLGAAYEALDEFVADNGYTLNGPIMEHYIKVPEDNIPEADFITAVYYPIKK